jgi:hypothetical protein
VVTAGYESVVHVKVLGFISLDINHQGIGTHLLARLQTPLNCTTHQESSQAMPAVFCMRCQSAHTETGDGVAGQYLLGARVKLFGANLRSTQTVVAKYGAGCIGLNQNSNDGDAFFALLGRKAVQVHIELIHARGECPAIMSGGVEKLFLKHV